MHLQPSVSLFYSPNLHYRNLVFLHCFMADIAVFHDDAWHFCILLHHWVPFYCWLMLFLDSQGPSEQKFPSGCLCELPWQSTARLSRNILPVHKRLLLFILHLSLLYDGDDQKLFSWICSWLKLSKNYWRLGVSWGMWVVGAPTVQWTPGWHKLWLAG